MTSSSQLNLFHLYIQPLFFSPVDSHSNLFILCYWFICIVTCHFLLCLTVSLILDIAISQEFYCYNYIVYVCKTSFSFLYIFLYCAP